MATNPGISPEALDRPFGKASRALAIQEFLASLEPRPASDMWKSVYELLLWTDPTTGLAHIYESDKSQPGRHWYPRTLAFHQWFAQQLGVRPRVVHRHIDFLFRQCLRVLAVKEGTVLAKRMRDAEKQYAPYEADGLPEPGENPELEDEVQQRVAEETGIALSKDAVRTMISIVQARLKRENKRKNLLGEGFEDTLAAVLGHAASATSESVRFYTGKPLVELPGFRELPSGAKKRTVDLAILGHPDDPFDSETAPRTLVSVKWSVRADREEQFGVDYQAYADSEVSGHGFSFVFVTNEFDPAPSAGGVLSTRPRPAALRLRRARLPRGAPGRPTRNLREGWPEVRKYIEDGRLIGLDEWLVRLGAISDETSA